MNSGDGDREVARPQKIDDPERVRAGLSGPDGDNHLGWAAPPPDSNCRNEPTYDVIELQCRLPHREIRQSRGNRTVSGCGLNRRLYGLFIVKRFQSGDLSFLLS
jgi:hypothetical protein